MAANWNKYSFFWGHASVLTTEHYLGCKQNLEEPVNDRFGCLLSTGFDSRQGLFSSVKKDFHTSAIVPLAKNA
jgi:hypothetical protein